MAAGEHNTKAAAESAAALLKAADKFKNSKQLLF